MEKPIAQKVSEGEKLVRRVEKDGASAHRASPRHSPIMAKAKEVVDSGVLGRLVAVMGSATFYKPDHYFVDGPWRREPARGRSCST